MKHPFDVETTFEPAPGKPASIFALPRLEQHGFDVARLPASIRVVLESLLRNFDGKRVREADLRALAGWQPRAERTAEVPFVVARVLLQDFTGVPLLVDLAAMRDAAARVGKQPKVIEPLVPVDLVIDHSVQVDYFGRDDAFSRNLEMEFRRNRPRYEFLKWGMSAFDGFRIIPPGIGICHQVNLEFLAKGAMERDGVWLFDTLVGTDSHTTMVNGLGVVAWGVGGIEAEAGMLGQPVYFLTPDVVGVNMHGALGEGVTATDLVLTITEMLRKAKVVGKFVEFHGEGATTLTVAQRATVGNMAPEYGATAIPRRSRRSASSCAPRGCSGSRGPASATTPTCSISTCRGCARRWRDPSARRIGSICPRWAIPSASCSRRRRRPDTASRPRKSRPATR
jgi:aconitate hydratase